METRLLLRSISRSSRCGLCLATAADLEPCTGCGATSHAACLRELGVTCPTIGCVHAGRELPAPLRCCQAALPGVGAPDIRVCTGCGGRWHRACLRPDACCRGAAAVPEEAPRPGGSSWAMIGSLRACNHCQALFEVQAGAHWSWRCPRCARNDTLILVAVVVGLVVVPFAGGVAMLLAMRP